MIRKLIVVRNEPDEDPVLAYIGVGVRQSMNCGDVEALRSWLDTLGEVQETRANPPLSPLPGTNEPGSQTTST